jgi:hypothetical protein
MLRLNLPAALSAMLAPTAVAQSDDFNDSVTGPQWATVIDNPAQLTLAEQNGRLEAIATGSTSPNNDALYLSGFALSTASGFEIAIDYNFTSFTSVGALNGAMALVLGVGRDLDGTDSAAIGYGPINLGFGTTGALGAAYRIDDAQTQVPLALGASAGTFVISYNATGDDLTLGAGTSVFTLADTVQAVWGADHLLVSFGVRGNGYNVSSGGAYLDDFVIRSGNVVPVPEPVSLTGFALAMLLLRHRRQHELSTQ